jgi:uncharacterized protein (UPF0548 family)
MMLSIRRPPSESIRHFLSAQGRLEFSYAEVGATANQPPVEFVVDRTRIKLGEGERAFQAAQAALRNWRHFDLGWVQAWPSDTPLLTGEVVAIVARIAGLWWLNACKIVYIVDERGPSSRFGFAYGTLPGHVERGEERFLIEWNHADDSVSYDILAFSQPNSILARIGYPMVRRTQKRFGRESAAAMREAVRQDEQAPAGQH